MTNNHLQTTQSQVRLTFLDTTQEGSPKWEVDDVVVMAKEGEDGPYIWDARYHLKVEYEHLEYDGNNPVTWVVGKDVIWSLKGNIYEGQVDRAKGQPDFMDVEVLVR